VSSQNEGAYRKEDFPAFWQTFLLPSSGQVNQALGMDLAEDGVYSVKVSRQRMVVVLDQ
jgi:hypothetical protein